jgi:hypothetical protein
MRHHLTIIATLLALTGALVAALAPASPASAAPYIEFMGERFIPRLSTMDALFGVGFDPVNRRVLSLELRTECGGAVMSNETADNGVSWDPVNQEFWYIGNEREVYHYVAGVKDVLFTIPENFDVPGEGPATLDRPEGLAVDMNHVYVVDAGDAGVRGQLTANEWFKFTRDGTPVKSSASTDFQAQLQPHFDAFGDCTVDGLAWIPPGSPFGEGLFLMAVEHSGIQVLDDEGMYVDRILWQDQGIPTGGVPTGFAGVTIDPMLGNLYLVENGGKLHVWERIQSDEPMTFVYGVAVPQLHQPSSPCGWGVTQPNAEGLLFSLTYRDVDELLWSIDFGSGEVFTLHPLYLRRVSVGTSTIVNAWGMAYDDERDVFYVYREVGSEFYVLDPQTLQSTKLPFDGRQSREIAFSSDDKSIYGVGPEDPANQDFDPVLIRFDRDTGEPTVVGPTVGVSGLAYDRVAQKLVAVTNGNGGQLYSIDPSTGQAQLLATGTSSGWEGLAAIAVDAPATAVEPIVSAGPTLGLRAFPNPLEAANGSIAFRMMQAGPVRASVLDLAGRRVASLYDGPLPAGSHELRWNGRDGDGLHVANGVYFIQLATPWETTSTKLTVLR